MLYPVKLRVQYFVKWSANIKKGGKKPVPLKFAGYLYQIHKIDVNHVAYSF
jgi:hypothetical protein